MAAGNRDLTGTKTSAETIGNPMIITKDIDFADIASVKGSTIEPNEVAQFLTIPKGMRINSVTMEILTAGASANALTASIGDGDSAAGFLAASDLKAAAATLYAPAQLTLAEGAPNTFVPAYHGGKTYSAADTLDLKVTAFDTVTVLPVVRVTVEAVMLRT